MAISLTEAQRTLIEGKNFASVATINADGSPQVTPIWADFDGAHVLLNSEEKRRKVRNLKRDPRVSVSIFDQQNPYDYVEVRGRVVEITREGAAEHIDKMAKKYLGQDKYPGNRPGDVRVIIRIEPEHAHGM
ncbi:MAG TPA: PPOX class F420-dependent oxidoreductase [Dehalococcoidia bacterium]|nr:PPOX class F420-dependent oxidoreductase [Dehalococcoidia bacterium]